MMQSNEVLARIAKDRIRDLQREAAVQRQRPSYRQRLAAACLSVAKWLEPELTEGVPAPRPLSR